MKKLSAIILSLCLIICSVPLTCFAEHAEAAVTVPYSYVLMEGNTSTLLYSENGSASFPAHHSAKLMTLLLTAEAMRDGKLSYDTVLKTSEHANSKQGAQIWLMPGEEISVEELVKSITIGNANDACTVLAEALGQTEDGFTKMMNARAEKLGMVGTEYFDCTGTDERTVTTAEDTAILASALLEHDSLSVYFTTWLDSVRDGKTQLASTNRLILSYNGIKGMKEYYSKKTENCLIAAAERDGLKIVCVIFGERDENTLFATAKEKLNAGFSAYMIYKPKRGELWTEPVRIDGGEKTEVISEAQSAQAFVIRKSQKDKLDISIEYGEKLKAPIKKGDEVGRAIYSVDGEELFSVRIVAAEDIRKMNFFIGMKRVFGFIFRV